MYGTPNAKPPTPSIDKIGFAACTFKVNAASTEVQLFPAGHFKARDGRPFEVDSWYIDATIAQRLIAEAALRTTPYIIDYEHQTLLSKDNGQPAPRSAKFTQLEWREDDGLYAIDVAWTTRAKEYIENDEYEFISPVFPYNKKTGAVLGLFHAALTNDPAVDGMESVARLAAASFHFNPEPTEKNIMNKELLKLLGLNDDANEEDVQTAVAVLTTQLTDMRTALGINDDVDGVTAIAALKTNTNDKPDPAKFVPVDLVKELQQEVASLKTSITTDEAQRLIDQAVADGKIATKLKRDYAESLKEAEDIASLKSYINAEDSIDALKNTQTGGKAPKDAGGETQLSDEAIAVCKQLGVSEKDYKKTLAA